MENSHYIQRLERPVPKEHRDNPLVKLGNAFSFGGGLKNGGIPEEGMKIIRDAFQFDYMGAAEYEWGEVPKALARIFENRENYIDFSFTCRFKSWKREGKSTVYVIAKPEWKDEIKKRIRRYAIGRAVKSNGFPVKVKGGVLLESAMAGDSERIKGWLELDNGYFFFIDEEMFNKTKEIFKIREHAEAK